MAATNGNPILPTELTAGDGRIRVSWTRRGLILAGLGVALFLVGMWRVDGVMAAMGLAVAALLVVARIFGRGNLRGLTLEYRGPRRVEAGKGFSGKVTLRNSRRLLDCFWVDFGVLLMGERSVSGRVLWLEGGGAAVAESRLVLTKRGCGDEQKGWMKSGFPLGLFAFETSVQVGAEVGVLARVKVPGELRLSGYLLDGPPLGGSGVFGGIGEWRGLREWRGGDAVRRIAWTASLKSEAAGGGLLVREDEPPGSQAEGCLLVFHSFGGDGNLIRPDRFEKALELMSGTAGVLQGWGMPVRWVADFDGWEGGEIRTRRQLAQTREKLMFAKRAAWTEAHDLSEALANAGDHECVVVISDMPKDTWEEVVRGLVQPPVLVDILKYAGSAKLEKGGRK
ncbi:MAG: DUF58 domain-containing protein [Verrucomicrobia bacterium]|nr:DUF58 domain-containing protein [Verrucomicrobiota bacterium]|tara:strand:+ start:5454 stop:6638 length:1185 start_codon:yes stop_codon:yes gene_type:complete